METFKLWFVSLLAGMGLSLSAMAADFTQGVSVSGNVATLWLKSNVSTSWVDVHYQLNGGGLQNLRMSYQAANDTYVNQVWSHYAANELVFTAEAGTFRGRVIGNDFVFSKDGGPATLYIRGKPTTQAILEGSGNLASGSPLELVVQAQITAAFNRHLLISVDPANWSTAASYYPHGPANYYAKFWHDHSIDGLAYGFCYDDVRGKSSLLEHPNPKGLIVTIGW